VGEQCPRFVDTRLRQHFAERFAFGRQLPLQGPAREREPFADERLEAFRLDRIHLFAQHIAQTTFDRGRKSSLLANALQHVMRGMHVDLRERRIVDFERAIQCG
jgi:hypothetical protein